MQAAFDFHPIGPIWWVWTGLSGLVCLDLSVWTGLSGSGLSGSGLSGSRLSGSGLSEFRLSGSGLSGSLQSPLTRPPSHHPPRSPPPHSYPHLRGVIYELAPKYLYIKIKVQLRVIDPTLDPQQALTKPPGSTQGAHRVLLGFPYEFHLKCYLLLGILKFFCPKVPCVERCIANRGISARNSQTF